MNCPRCGGVMQERSLAGSLGRPVTVDICQQCQCFWFDGHESLQLAPGSVLQLFTLIGERTERPPIADGETLRCPRCRARLHRVSDLQRSTRFGYSKCPHEHGRLMSFFDFLKTKNFLRPLTPQQVAELRQHMQTVNCHNCGAAVDLATSSACGHCGTPLSLWDMKHAATAVEQLREHTRRQPGSASPDDEFE